MRLSFSDQEVLASSKLYHGILFLVPSLAFRCSVTGPMALQYRFVWKWYLPFVGGSLAERSAARRNRNQGPGSRSRVRVSAGLPVAS